MDAASSTSHPRGVLANRGLGDRISPDLIAAFDEAGISIASATFEITGLPLLRVAHTDEPPRRVAWRRQRP